MEERPIIGTDEKRSSVGSEEYKLQIRWVINRYRLSEKLWEYPASVIGQPEKKAAIQRISDILIIRYIRNVLLIRFKYMILFKY